MDDFEEAFQRARARDESAQAAAEASRLAQLSLQEQIRSIAEPYLEALAPLVRAKLIGLGVGPVQVRKGVRYWNLGNGIWEPGGWVGTSSNDLALSWDGVFISTRGSGGIVDSEAAGQKTLLSQAFFFSPGESLGRYRFQGPLCVEKGSSRVCVLFEAVGGTNEGYFARTFADYVGEQVHFLERKRRRGRQGTQEP